MFFRPFLEYAGKLENTEETENIVFYENDGRTVIYPIETFDEYDRRRYDLPSLPFRPRPTDWKFKIDVIGTEPLVIYDGCRLRPQNELINSKGVLVRRYSTPVGVIVKIISREGAILLFKPTVKYCRRRNDYWINIQLTNEGLPTLYLDWLKPGDETNEEASEDAIPLKEALQEYQQYRANNPIRTKPR